MIINLQLLTCRHLLNLIHNSTNSRNLFNNNRLQPHTRKHNHHNLAVHPISNPPMSRNRVSKILDFKSPFNSRCKKPSKRSNKPSKKPKNNSINFNIRHNNTTHPNPLKNNRQHSYFLRQKPRQFTLNRCKRLQSNIRLRTNHFWKLHKQFGKLNKPYEKRPYHSCKKCTYEALPSLIWT